MGGCSACGFQPSDTLAQVAKDHNILDMKDMIETIVRAETMDRERQLDPSEVRALQAEGAEWSIAVGTVDRNLVFSVRNVGYVRAAGEVVRAVVEGLGVGGGHRSMAKGIIPLKAFREVYGRADRNQIRSALYDAFVRAIHDDGSKS